MIQNQYKTILFGGGCFWCTEAIFKMLKGVTNVMPGYVGGTTKNPTYEEVCTGRTGHAEVIKIEYDAAQTKFKDLLTVFFATHDPTTPNQQGADIGTQYRSTILYTTNEQKVEAEQFIKELNISNTKGNSIITEIKALIEFYPAENYHQDYYSKNKNAPYCQIVINPKLEKVQKEFAKLLKI